MTKLEIEAINDKYKGHLKKLWNVKTNDEYIIPETASINTYLSRGDVLLEVFNGKEWIKISDKPFIEKPYSKKIKSDV